MTPESELTWTVEPDRAEDAPNVVLILHGGKQTSTAPVTNSSLSYVRMWDFAHALKSAVHGTGTGVALLRYAVRGWNDPRNPSPVQDARTALEGIRSTYPKANVVLLGHSMGGRTAARIVGEDNVSGACLLAPWFPPGEPIKQCADRRIVVAHGTRDRWTSPRASLEFCQAVRRVGGQAARAEIDGEGHFMLKHPVTWRRFAARVSLGLLGVSPLPAAVESALDGDDVESLRLPIAEAIAL